MHPVQRLVNGVQRWMHPVQRLVNGVQRWMHPVQRLLDGVQRWIHPVQRLISKKTTTRSENFYFPILTKEKLGLESCASVSPLFAIPPTTSDQIADKLANGLPIPTPQVVKFLLMPVPEHEDNQD